MLLLRVAEQVVDHQGYLLDVLADHLPGTCDAFPVLSLEASLHQVHTSLQPCQDVLDAMG